MAEQTAYFESVVASRAMMLSDQDSLEGHTTVSLETQADLAEDDLLTCIQESFDSFLKMLRSLNKEDQELLLSYYLLSKTQNTLARIHKFTQTVCSSYLRMAVKRIGMFLLLGDSKPETIQAILIETKLEETLEGVPLSEAIALYEKTRSFQYVADKYKLHRPDIRRAMSRASKKLIDSKDDRHQVLGAYIHGLIDKASAAGQGFSKRKLAKQCHIYRVDSPLLGTFRIDMANPEVEQLFVSRANR